MERPECATSDAGSVGVVTTAVGVVKTVETSSTVVVDSDVVVTVTGVEVESVKLVPRVSVSDPEDLWLVDDGEDIVRLMSAV